MDFFFKKRFIPAGNWNAQTSKHLEDEDTSPEPPPDSEINGFGDVEYTSMGRHGNSVHASQRAAERTNSKGRSISRKVNTLLKIIGIPRNPVSTKVARLLKARPKFLEPFMRAYVDAKSYFPQAGKNTQVDDLVVTDGRVLTETEKPDDWGSGEPPGGDDEEQITVENSSGDQDFRDNIVYGLCFFQRTKRFICIRKWIYTRPLK